MNNLPQAPALIPAEPKNVFTGETYKKINCVENIISIPSQMYGLDHKPSVNMDFVIERQLSKYML